MMAQAGGAVAPSATPRHTARLTTDLSGAHMSNDPDDILNPDDPFNLQGHPDIGRELESDEERAKRLNRENQRAYRAKAKASGKLVRNFTIKAENNRVLKLAASMQNSTPNKILDSLIEGATGPAWDAARKFVAEQDGES